MIYNRIKRWMGLLLAAGLLLNQCMGTAMPVFAAEAVGEDAAAEEVVASENEKPQEPAQAEESAVPEESVNEEAAETVSEAEAIEELLPSVQEGDDTADTLAKETVSSDKVSENGVLPEAVEDNEDNVHENKAGEKITWGDYYTAIKDDENHTLTLTKYNGNESSITVPAKATIGSADYKIVVGYDEENFQSIWAGDSDLESISFGEGFEAPGSCFGLFEGCEKLTSLDLSNFDTSNVWNMTMMFSGCSSLTSLNVSGFNTSNVTGMGGMFQSCNSLENLDLSKFDTSKVKDMRSMFSFCNSLTSLNVSKFDTSDVTDFGLMFRGCSSLTSLDVSGFNTSKVEDMDGMFDGCSNLTSLDVSKFDTASVTNMWGMFRDCSSLMSLDVSKFDTSEVTDIDRMFSGCRSLTSLDVSNFDTSNVTDMGYMFYGCSSLTSLDVSKFDTSNVTDMGGMFFGCSSLTSLDVSGFDTSKVTDMSYMFSGCSSLACLDVSKFNTSNVTDMGYMFSGCSSLTSLDVCGFDTSSVTNMGGMFRDCSSLTSLDLSKFNTSNVTDMWNMFSGCSSLTSLDLSKFNTSKVTSMGGMFSYCSSLTSLDVSSFDTSSVTNMGGMFRDCSSLTSLDLSKFNTSNVTDIVRMFGGCSSLTSLDLSKFNTSNVTDMGYMFDGCSSLTSLDVSGFDTSSVTYMSGMFYGCSSLTSLNLSNFNTSKVTSMGTMFQDCSGLMSLDVSGFDTSSVTFMSGMFAGCNSLTSLNLSKFDTSSVENMNAMFYGCSSLTSLDLSSFDTSNVTDMWGMFYGCSSLTSLDVSGFNTSKVTIIGNMFNSCSSLASLDLSSFDTSGCGNSNMLKNTPSLLSINTPFKTDTSVTIKLYGKFSGEEYSDIVEIPAGLTKSIALTRSGTIPLESLSTNRPSVDIEIGKGRYTIFSVLFNPENATDRRLIWSSKDESIATVNAMEHGVFEDPDSGEVTGLKPGKTTVSATSVADPSIYIEFDVNVDYKEITEMALNPSSVSVRQSETVILKAIDNSDENYPQNIDPEHITWSSDDPDIATVDEKGYVSARSQGKTTITAKYKGDESVYAFCELTVTPGDPSKIPVTGVKFNKAEEEVALNNTAQLTWTVAPSNATNQKVTFSSSSNEIATVNNSGVVTGKSAGSTYITVKTEDGGYTDSCKVTVKEVKLKGISLPATEEVPLSGNKTLTVTFDPADASNKNLTWSVSDDKIATVKNGVVTGVALGSTVVTAVAEDGGYTASCNVTVKENSEPEPTPEPTPVPEEGSYIVTFMSGNEVFHTVKVKGGERVSEPENKPVRDGYSFVGWTRGTALWNFFTPIHSNLTLNARFIPAGGAAVSENTGSGRDPVPVESAGTVYLVKGQSFTPEGTGFSITDGQDILKLNKKSGTVSAKKKGTGAISNGTKTYKLIVAAPYFEKEAKKLSLIVGETKDVTGLFKLDSPDGKTDMYPVTWDSLNSKVASVYDGNITALAKGSAKIRAYVGGRAYTCSLKVTDTYKAPNKLTGKDDSFSMNPLQSFTLKYDKSVFTVKKAEWSISPNSVVEISTSGKITATATGTAKVTGKDTKGRTASFTVTVAPVPAKENTYITVGKKESIKFPFVKNKKATWDSSDKNVISSYTNGNVKGAKVGSSTISCSINGFGFSTLVYVEAPEFDTEGGRLVKSGNKYTLTLKEGEVYNRLKMNNVYQTITFNSSKNTVAFVDENGFVYARKKGKANISTKINGKTYKIAVTVE